MDAGRPSETPDGGRGAGRVAATSILPPFYLGLAAVTALFGAAVYAWLAAFALGHGGGMVDVRYMQELGRRWIASGSMYLPYQLGGPYGSGSTPLPGLYPPACGPLFAALSLVPTAILTAAWLVAPVVVVGTALWHWRPARWSWAPILLMLSWPTSAVIVVNGGTTLWVAAAVAAALSGAPWAAALVLLKPTFAPLALLGVRSRGWWAVCGVMTALTIAGPWLDYARVLANVRGADYQLWSVPIVLAPVVAWMARSTVRSKVANRDARSSARLERP